jgi:SRSO17 transposase
VQRQYTGTAERIENAQVAVFWRLPLAWTGLGRREVYLPKVWTEDRERCRAAGLPDEVSFASKVTLGRGCSPARISRRVAVRKVCGSPGL